MSFPGAVLEVLRTESEKIAVEHGQRLVTRGVLAGMIGRLAEGLRAEGLGPGSGVAMKLDVGPESLAAYLAAFACGCRVAGLRPGLSESHERHIIGDAAAVLTQEKVARILGADRPAAASGTDPAGPLVVTTRPGDVARLGYTSGSTGLPKGCAQTYAAMDRHWSWGADWGESTRDLASRTGRYLLFGTLASAFVQDMLALCLRSGGTVVIPDLGAYAGRPLFPSVIEDLRITASIMNVPRLYQMLQALDEGDHDLSSLRALMVAGSPLVPHRLKEAADRLGPVVFSGYGLTETGHLATLTPDDIAAGVIDAVGRPLENVDLEVRDGELYARTPYQMSGYWQDPEQTGEVLVGGWVRTRDLGHLDGQGYVHLTGRARDVIIVDAFPVYAGPIEQVLASLPGVDQAYVAGAPDDRRGEAVHAFVVPRDAEKTPDPDALAQAVREALGDLSVPQTIEFVPEAPMAPSGKPDKRALLDLYPRV